MSPRLNSINVYRVRDAILARNSGNLAAVVLAEDQSGLSIQIGRVPITGERLLLAVAPPRRARPTWRDMLQPAFKSEIKVPLSISTGAVLIAQPANADTPTFALTFGSGRHLLAPEAIEPNFGLRVALNTISGAESVNADWDAARVRSVSARRVDANTMLTVRQSTRRATFETFGIDIQQDFVKSVTGRPVDATWGTRITGADSCRVAKPIDLANLGELCTALEEAFQETNYRQRFSWLDNVRQVNEPSVITRLDLTLLNAMRAPESYPNVSLDLAPPLLVDWDSIQEFRLNARWDSELSDPTLAAYQTQLEGQERWVSLDLAALKRHSITAISDQGVMGRWSVYRCLAGEFTLEDGVFVIHEGHYYRVDTSYLAELERYIGSITRWSTALLDWPEKTLETSNVVFDEKYYNLRATESLEGAICLDRRLVTVAARTDTIEICDILTDQGDFIHVKNSGDVGGMSHLFSQATTSAELVVSSDDFRARSLIILNRALEERSKRLSSESIARLRAIFSERPAAGKLQAIIAIAGPWKTDTLAGAISFFSKVNLRARVEDLKRLGFRVSYAPIVRRSNVGTPTFVISPPRRRRAGAKLEPRTERHS